ncbi:MAG: SusC/RagA family TonB-linked outer membrane protein [Adhaeribacter sp.]
MKKRITRLWTRMPVPAGRCLLLLLLAFTAFQHADAQTKPQVTGKVTSADGEVLPGVSVVVKNTTTGTVTDQDGLYTLALPEGAATLVFSFIGFMPQEVAVANRSQVNVTLQVDAKALEEVVVVGYGTQKKVNLTGSVAAISSEELTVVPVANTTTALAGKLPGLIAVQPSGEPGRDNANLSIRGFGNALVVVDGIVGRDFARLNPNEIESITILKDAASTAVYGVSGGNGVILVTTKKGHVGKPELGYSMNYGVQTVTKYPRFVNSAEYAELKNEAATNLGGTPQYTPEEIEKFRNGTDPNYPNFDYYDYFVKDYAPQLQQNLTVRGGSENIKYFFLLGQTSQESMWEGDNQDYKQYNFRTNVDAQITKNLDISVGFGARKENRDNLVQDSYLMASWLQYSWPVHNPKTPDGKIASTNYGLTAYLDRDLTGYIEDRRNIFQGNLSVNYKIPFVPGLSARVTAAQDLNLQDEKQWRKKYQTYTWNEATQTSLPATTRETDRILVTNWKSTFSRIQTSLNYARVFADKHNVSALLLYEEAEEEATNFWASRQEYVVPIDQLFAGPDFGKNNNSSASENGRQSLVGRVNYDFLGRYLLEYSFRYDGSAKFPVDKRWGFFSGLSGGWRLSEEKFLKGRIRALDDLKLRASWGQSGNDNTGNFQYLTGYSYPSRNYIMGDNVVTNGFVPTGVPNPNITWEQIEMWNLGLDLSLWNQKLELEADAFYRHRGELLAQRTLQLPSTFGATLPSENLNSDNTRGFEVVLRHRHQIGELQYMVAPNVSFTRSKWDYVEQKPFNSQYDSWRNNIQDRWNNLFWGYKAIGQFQSEEDIKSSPIQDNLANSTLRPGDIKYDDFNHDGVIDGRDEQVIGRSLNPELFYGLGMDLSWRKFSLNMTWQGASHFSVEQQHFLIQPFANGMNAYAYFLDRWRKADPDNPDSAWIPGKYPSTINDGAPNNKLRSSFWLKDGTYLRLKFLGLSYNLDLLSKIGIKQASVMLSGQNLLTFSGLGPIDPESPSGRLSYYPQQKTYNLGINVSF